MNKKMRDLQAQILEQTETIKGFMSEGEGRDLTKAEQAMDRLDELKKEYEIEARAAEALKSAAADNKDMKELGGKADGFKAFSKVLAGRALDADEKALISGTDAESGENLLIPEDVKTEINLLRKTYVSAKSLVNVMTTDALTGGVNYEKGTPAGLTAFDDGEAIAEGSNPVFERKTFTIGWHGKIIPISRILLGASKADLMGYLNHWFVRNAVITENGDIFATLKAGYNGGTVKAVAGWKALKKSITVDLDPSCLLGGVIITNQSGFAALDAEEDADGRPVLQPNPANPTEKLFQGLPVKVFPDAQLPNIDATHFPMIYGDTKAGCTFVEHKALEFAVSEHANFTKNQDTLRVLEGFDTMSTDTSAYIYGSFSATVQA